MANVCCDDVYFYSDTNPEGLVTLWKDIQTSITICPDANRAWIGKLFEKKGISMEGIYLRGTVTYMERNNDNILLSTDTAWSPLYEAYESISEAYNISFVMQSIEPGEGIYINTDTPGRFFPDKYTISFPDEAFITPSGVSIGTNLEDGEPFDSDESLLKRFKKLGYIADSVETLKSILEEDDIYIHKFGNPYDSDDEIKYEESKETSLAKYAISVREILKRTVIVEAEDITQAIGKVEAAVEQDLILLDIDDYDDREIIPSEYWDGGKVPDNEDVSYYWHLEKIA